MGSSLKKKLNINSKDIVLGIVVLMILLISISRIIVVIKTGMVDLRDHQWIWTECRIAWYGVDPYTALREDLTVQGLHTYEHISSLPWGLTLGTIFHGAFLPYSYSLIWYNALRVLILLTMLVLLWHRMEKEGFSTYKKVLGLLLVPAPWYSISSIITGNNGEPICFLIMIALCIMEEHEVLAGFIMLFAMIKPQIAIPFFVIFLFYKKWKLISVSVTGVFTAWEISAAWTHTNPVEQLMGMVNFAETMEEGYHVVGILDALRHLGMASQVALILSMLTGLIILGIVSYWVSKKVHYERIFILYSIPAIVSIMWCYKTECDYMILILAALAVFELWTQDISWKMAAWLLAALCMLYTKPFSSFLLGRLSFLSDYQCNRLDLYMKTAVLLILIGVIRRKKDMLQKLA